MLLYSSSNQPHSLTTNQFISGGHDAGGLSKLGLYGANNQVGGICMEAKKPQRLMIEVNYKPSI